MVAIERVAYVAFEPFPNAKGSGTRIGQMLRALVGSGREVVLLTLPGRGAGELPPGVEHRALPVFRGNFLERALAEATDADADICDAASLVYSVSCSIDAESRAVSLRFSGTCRECQFSIVFDHEHTFDPWSS